MREYGVSSPFVQCIRSPPWMVKIPEPHDRLTFETLGKKNKNIQQRGFASGHPPNY